MPVREVSVADRDAVEKFARLEPALMRDQPLYVPPTRKDVVRRLTGRSALHEGIEHAMFVASEGIDVARCAAFVNRRWQGHHRESAGFVGYFAAAPGHRDLVAALLGRADEWLAAHGVTRVIAPYDGSSLAGMALRTAEFDRSPPFPMQWHPPYYADYLEAAGYRPTYPWWSWRFDMHSERHRETASRALGHPMCHVRPIDKSRWDDELRTVLALFNAGFAAEWEFYPFTIEEFREVFGQFKLIVDPYQVLFAEVDGEPAGLCIAVPDLNPVFRPLGGRLGPVEMVRLYLGARRVRSFSSMFLAVLERFRGRHIGQTLMACLHQRIEQYGIIVTEGHMMNDRNATMRNLLESLGGEGRVVYHNFDKPL